MLNRPLPLVLLLLLGSCSKATEPGGQNGDAGAQARGALVARVGKVELHEEDLRQAMARDPGTSAQRFESVAAQRELLDGLVRFELLAQAADKAGFTKDPEAIHALQQIAVTKLVNQTLGAVAAPETITAEDIQRDYAARQASEFTLPPAAEVRHILISDAKRAEHLAQEARALAPADDRGFASFASSSSEDSATRASGGDLGFIDKSSRLPSAIVEAALNLKTPGEVVGPLQTPSGYEILRLVSLRAGAVSPLSSVAEPIRQRLYRERRAKALEAFIARLRAETPVEIIEQKPAAKSAP
jgi:peptidyl-prolyl cis-trans isomerase C